MTGEKNKVVVSFNPYMANAWEGVLFLRDK